MKKNIYILLIFMLLFGSLNLLAQEYEKGKILIKLKSGSEQYNNYKQSQNNNLVINELNGILGTHKILPYIEPKLLKISNTLKPQIMSSINKNRLDAWIEIIYTNDVDPKIAVTKLRNLEFIEYIEPKYIMEFVYHPNDTLLGSQYYLDKIRAFDAWDVIVASNLPDSQFVKIGIVDTGVDYFHPDLQDNLYYNPGENGLDNNGMNKSSNGLDDDANGYIDDWCGWDFVSTGENNGDNVPLPGNAHGTHVAGICSAVQNNFCGIAGTAIKVKYLPVKISRDDPSTRTIEKGLEGILYAANMGCEIINCSWGGTGFSQAAQDVINTVSDMGSLVIAAAGNDGSDVAFYPASYKGVCSVSSTDIEDNASRFTNYNYTVDVSAPGSGILSTIPNAEYDSWNGTSMASPVASGVAAMIKLMYPTSTSQEIAEILKVSSDNIDSININYNSKLGYGRINAYKAITKKNLKSIIIDKYSIIEENPDNVLSPGEKLEIYLNLSNILDTITNLKLRIYNYPLDFLQIKYEEEVLSIGDLLPKEKLNAFGPIRFTIPQTIPFNYKMNICLMFFDSKDYIYKTGIELIGNQTYLDLDKNKLKMTVTSTGNIAYNDYPNNIQGNGCYFNDVRLLFEGALIIGTGLNKVSDAARNEYAEEANVDFFLKDIIMISDSNAQYSKSRCRFNDFEATNSSSKNANIDIMQTNFQFKKDELMNTIFLQLDIINKGNFTDSLFAGYFFDWDIANKSDDDRIIWDYENKAAIIQSTSELASPFVAVIMLSNHRVNFTSIDNNASDKDFIGIYNGFSKQEKWRSISSGILRDTTSICDCSMVLSAGPISLRKNDTTRITYAVVAAETKDELIDKLNNTKIFARDSLFLEPKYLSYIHSDAVKNIFPNPAYKNEMKVYIALKNESFVNLKVINEAGQEVYTRHYKDLAQGRHYLTLTPENIAPGAYVLIIESKDMIISKKVIFVK